MGATAWLKQDGSATNHVRRERALALSLALGADTDRDGMPDWWEQREGTKVTVADADEDPDYDGLTNKQEFDAGTRPKSSDSDGGGESDKSEIDAHRNPNDGTDDAMKPPPWQIYAGFGKVLVQGPPVRIGRFYEVRRGPKPGPYTFVRMLPWLTDSVGYSAGVRTEDEVCLTDEVGQVRCPAVDGVETCIIAREVGDGVASGWSAPSCVIPAADPYPPRIEFARLGDVLTYSRATTLELGATDTGGEQGPADADTVSSGVKQMAISFDGKFTSVLWQPYKPSVALWLPDAGEMDVFVKVRDGAGLESSATRLHAVRGAARHDADRAVALEERALDALRANNFGEARRLVRLSLDPLGDTVRGLLPRCGPGGREVDRELRRRFVGVLAKKAAVQGLLAARKRQAAEVMLVEALEAEREAVKMATDAGTPL